jgi:TetR/AcrR family transcriptional regulator, mexJK operon transcriptional repressor
MSTGVTNEMSAPRPRQPVSRKPAAVKARILAAAEAEFMQHGYDEGSTTRIAQGFGGAKNTIFRHFESKRLLFLAVIEGLVVRWKDRLDLESISVQDPELWLEAYTIAILRWIISDEMIFVAEVADAVRRKMPEIIEIFRKQGHNKFAEILQDRLETWTKEGLLDCRDAEEDATDFINLALVKWLNRRKLLNVPMPTEAQIQASARETVRLYLYGRAKK